MKTKQVISAALIAAMVSTQPMSALASVVVLEDQMSVREQAASLNARSNVMMDLANEASLYSVKGENERKEQDFNSSWKFIDHDDAAASEIDYDESNAEEVGLPHSTVDYDLYNVKTDEFYKKTWYRRHFSVPESEQGNRVEVQFEGGGAVNRVYVNGAFVGEAIGTFTQFSMDISDYITYGDYDNVIAVQVDSKPHWGEYGPNGAPDFYFFGALHGEAKMIITDPLYVEDAFYVTNGDHYKEDGAVTLEGEVVVSNEYPSAKECEVTAILADANGQEVARTTETVTVGAEGKATVKLAADVANPDLWTPDNPYLYKLTTQVAVQGTQTDNKTINYGLRWIEVTEPNREDGYMYLNGEPMSHIQGAARHTQAAYLGNSSPKILEVKDAHLLKEEAGCDMVRTAHYTTTNAFLEECDRIGLMVEAECFGFSGMPKDAYEHYLREMIIRDRNHPSIMMWNVIPNESELNNYPMDWRMDSADIAKELDQSRFYTQEEWMYSPNKQVPGVVFSYHEYTTAVGKEPAPGGGDLNRPDLPVMIGEYNDNCGASFPTSGSSESRKIQSLLHDAAKMNSFKGFKGIIAYIKWAFAGYYTPRSIDVNARNRGTYRFAGMFGPLKDKMSMSYFGWLNKAQTSEEPVLMIANENLKTSDHTVYVISNYPKVSLLANGEPVTAEPIEPTCMPNLDHPIFEFELPETYEWSEDATLVAVGCDEDGNEQQRYTRYASGYDTKTAEEGGKVVLYNTTGQYRDDAYGQDEDTIYANGADLAFLMANVQDENGQSQYYADGIPNVKTEGVGEAVYGGNLYMDDGLSGFYIRSDEPGDTTATVSVDTGVTYDDTAFTYTGNWTEKNNIDTTTTGGKDEEYAAEYIYCYENEAYNESVHASSTPGDSAIFTFNGTRVALYSTIRFTQGTMMVQIDDGPQKKVNLTAELIKGTDSNHRVFMSDELAPGEHTIKVTVGTGGEAQIDSVKVFDGVADLVSNPITITAVAPDYEMVSTPNEGAPKAPSATEVYNKETLARKIETAKAINLDGMTEESSAALKQAIADAEAVYSKAGASVEEIKRAMELLDEAVKGLVSMTDLEIPYYATGEINKFTYHAAQEGTWHHNDTNTGYAYTDEATRTAGDSYSIRFAGTGLDLYAYFYSGAGIAEVTIDGAEAEKIDLYQETGERKLLKSFTGLEAGIHEVVVKVTGEKNDASSGTDVTCAGAVIPGQNDSRKAAWVALKNKMAEAEALNRADFTRDDLQALDVVYYEAKSVLESADASEEELLAAKDALTAALDELYSKGIVTIWWDNETNTEGTVGSVYYSPGHWNGEGGHGENANKYLPVGELDDQDYLSVTFEGTAIDLYSRFNENNGYVWVSVDNGEEEKIDLYKSLPRETKIFKSYTGLENGVHTVKVRAANETSGGAKAGMNFVKAVIPPVVEIPTEIWHDAETTNPEGELNKVYYSERATKWGRDSGHTDAGNTYAKRFLVSGEEYYLVKFEGTAIDLYARFNENNGIAAVSIDGGAEEQVSLYKAGTPATRETKIFKSYRNLEEGEHVVKVRATGLRDQNAGVTDESIKSINFVKAVEPENAAAIDLTELEAKVAEVNAVTQGEVLDRVWNTYLDELKALANGVILAGEYPNITVVDPVPADVTPIQLEKLIEQLDQAMAILGIETDLEISRIVYPKEIWVDYGTLFEDLELPETVMTYLENGNELELPVLWEIGDYDCETSDVYEIIGELVIPEGIKNSMVHVPSIRVTVTEAELFGINAVVEGGGTADVVVAEEALPGDTVTVQISNIEKGWEFDSITAAADVEEGSDGEEDIASDSNWSEDDMVATASDWSEDVKTATSSDWEDGSEEDADDIILIMDLFDDLFDDSRDAKAAVNANGEIELDEVAPGAEYTFVMPNADVTITVNVRERSAIEVKRVTVSGPSTIGIGETIKLQAKVLPTNADDQDVTWNVEGDAVSFVENGNVLNITGLKAGAVKVTAEAGGVESSTFILSVKAPETAVEEVKITGPGSVKVKKSVTLKATVYPADATDTEVTWLVDGDAATYRVNGNAIVFTGVKKGKVTVVACADGVKSKTFKLNVISGSSSSGSSGSGSSSGGKVSGFVVSSGLKADDGGSWVRDEKGWRYPLNEGGYAADQWRKITWNGVVQWYHFGKDGYMTTGWFQDLDGAWYYLHPVSDGNMGYMYTGRKVIDEKSYYFSEIPGAHLGMWIPEK